MGQVHDDEIDTSEAVVRRLLASQCPTLAARPLTPLVNTGTSNALWRVHGSTERDCIVRLPRTTGAERSIRAEHRLLPALGRSILAGSVQLPTLVHIGAPDDAFALPWTVLAWIEGDDAWTKRRELERSDGPLAVELATVVQITASLTGLAVPERRPGMRGGPLLASIDRLHQWLEDPRWSADALVDTDAVRRSADESAEVAGEAPTIGFVHGDLIPGNVLLVDGHLAAVIDWGGAGYGDLAQDLDPAWSILGPAARAEFRAVLGADDAAWLRGRAFALEQAVGAVLYYRPRNHPLADVMARTLDRILADGR